jgi:hypothetical protein
VTKIEAQKKSRPKEYFEIQTHYHKRVKMNPKTPSCFLILGIKIPQFDSYSPKPKRRS